MIPRLRVLLVPALALSALCFASCSGGSTPAKLTDEGYAALGKSDWSGAAADFDKALAGLKSTDPGFLRAKMGQVEALVHLDAPKAKQEFLAVATGVSSQVGAKEDVAVASKLAGERKFSEAIDVLAVGKTAYPEDVKIKNVGNAMLKEATKAGDSESAKRLKGLGYLGDD